jgi:hypothetical protein
MRSRRWLLPLVLGLITAVLLAAALWPQEPPTRAVVVAARDLGAGAAVAPADLAVVQLPAAQAPADAVSDPARLAGQTLAVVRFAGEAVTPRHLGPVVTLAPDERGIALKVRADTGLAGLLRPGMKVGVIATLADAGATRDMYAKTVLEGLRVLYVAPEFQARPYAPATASSTVKPGGGSALGLDSTATSNPGSTGTVREGVLVLAASTQVQPIRYEVITDTLKLQAPPPTSAPNDKPKGTAAAPTKTPPVRWVAPVELLAALNAAGDSLTLTLVPEAAQGYATAGVTLAEVRNALADEAPR